MPVATPVTSTVRHISLHGKPVGDSLATCDNICNAGAQCVEVQNAPIAKTALAGLQNACTTMHTSLSNKLALAVALLAAIKQLRIDFAALRDALLVYETAVRAICHGDASLINKSGCASRGQRTPAAALEGVTGMTSKQGSQPMDAVVKWPEAPGADTYALEINLTPQNPAGPWTPGGTGSRRRRVLKAPAPGAQMLVRVAAIGSDGTQAPWSDTLLVTAR